MLVIGSAVQRVWLEAVQSNAASGGVCFKKRKLFLEMQMWGIFYRQDTKTSQRSHLHGRALFTMSTGIS